jgi:hypothetical protein
MIGVPMIDAILALIIFLVVAAVMRPVLMMVRQRAKNTRDARHAGARPRHEWEPRTDRLYRRAAGVPRPAEDRDAILAFLTSRQGVEAYMEPKTVMPAVGGARRGRRRVAAVRAGGRLLPS